MPSAEFLIQASYALCVVTLVGLAAFVLLDLMHWAKRARDEGKS